MTSFQMDGEMGPYPLSNSMPNDGEMGPYPLSNSADGEMGPYPLSDNTNLLGPNSYGSILYRNYGTNYNTNYTVNSNTCTSNYCKQNYQCIPNNTVCDDRSQYHYRSQCDGRTRTKSKSKHNTPVPTRRNDEYNHERDSFRRHSMHGRISSQGTTQK